MRIVCLSPALTDILLALGLGDRIVGRDTWESQLPAEVPRVGDLTSANLEALLALEPTDVVIQARRAGAPGGLESIAAARGWRLVNLQIDALADVRQAVEQLVEELTFSGERDERRRDIRSEAQRLVEELDNALRPIPPEIADRLGPVMLLYSTDPPSAFGPGSYLSDMLDRLGGRNALSGGAWQELDAERVRGVDPWAIILVQSENSGGSRDAAEPLPPALARLDLTCASAGRVALLRHPRALLPGASLIEVAAELRAILERLASGQGSRQP